MLHILGQQGNLIKVQVEETGAVGYINKANVYDIIDASANNVVRMNRNAQVINVSSVVNVRTAPSMGAKVETTLTNGTQVRVTGKAGDWFRVSVNGVKGYIFGEYLECGNFTTSNVTSNSTSSSSTGYAVKSGEIINVYVDVEDGKPTPQLVFKQMDSQHNGQVVINLNKGRNVIKVPEVSSGELRPGTPKSGVLYTSNPYTAEEQGRKPKIRIEGAIKYPHYIKGVHTDEEVMKNLEDYVKLLEQDSNLPDVFDVFSDKTLVNVKATYALDWFKQNNKLPSKTS